MNGKAVLEIQGWCIERRRVHGILAACILLAGSLIGCGEPGGAATSEPTPTDTASDAGRATVPVARDPAKFAKTPSSLDELETADAELCAIRVNGVRLSASPLRVEGAQALRINGWLGDESTSAWPERPLLLLERAAKEGDLWRLDLGDPVERGDVARRLELPTMHMSGFELEVGIANLPSGNYRLYAAYESEAGQLHICRRGGALAVSN